MQRENRRSTEVYEVEAGKGRAQFTFDSVPLQDLPAEAPLPQVGDIVLLSSSETGDSKDLAFVGGGMFTPFRVVEREHMLWRGGDEARDPQGAEPPNRSKCLIHVRRVSAEEYGADPGAEALH
jgi:hypothetical protein